jgi:transcriptional regulator with XRE-family HTH domain
VASAPVANEELQERIRRADGEHLAARLREARLTADGGAPLSHDRLGARIGVGRAHLIKLEQAKHRPRAGLLTKYAEATGRSVDWFLDATDGRPFPVAAGSTR